MSNVSALPFIWGLVIHGQRIHTRIIYVFTGLAASYQKELYGILCGRLLVHITALVPPAPAGVCQMRP